MKKLRLLVVDDSPMIRKMVEGFLRHASTPIEIFEASNGKDALALAQSQHLDLILCDINMPGMDGLEFLRTIRADDGTRNIPVVIISAEGRALRVKEAVEAGAQGFLRKPFTAQEMRDQIVRVLGQISIDAP
ncbi:MAG TPA: response regulator [Terriglobia bacterium]|nr:response regulator [Terriglobia bacterium]